MEKKKQLAYHKPIKEDNEQTKKVCMYCGKPATVGRLCHDCWADDEF
jgi:hypothetical protein